MSPRTAAPAQRSSRSLWRSGGALVLLIAVCQAAGAIGTPFTGSEPGGWYDELDKAWFHPPSAVFAPVWITLYTVIGVAAWRVWRLPASRERSMALILFGVQLVLNALWTPLFFGLERPAVALAEIVAMFVAAAVAAWWFGRLDRWAAVLMIPYLAWIAFATLLNASVVALN